MVRREHRRLVTATGSATGRAVHTSIGRPDDFDEKGSFPSELIRDNLIPAQRVPPELIALHDPRAERVCDGVRVQVFEGLTSRVSIRLGLGTATFHVGGKHPRVGRLDGGPLVARVVLGAVAATVLAIASTRIVAAYASRHEWFVTEGAWRALSLVLTIGTLAGFVATLRLAEGRPSTTRMLAPLVTVLFAGVLGAAIYASANPSAAHAAALADRGEIGRAEIEADAARRFTADRGAAEAVLDRAHRSRAERTSSVAALVHSAGEPWFEPAVEAEIHAYADREHLVRVHAARGLDQVEALSELRWFDEHAATDARAVLHAAIADAIAVSSTAGHESDLRSLEPRVAALAPDLVPRVDRQLALFAVESCRSVHDWSCVADRIADARAAGAPDDAWLAARDEAVTSVRASGRAAVTAAGATGDSHARATHLHEALDDARLLVALDTPDTALDPVTLATRAATADASARRDAERRQHQADLAAERQRRSAVRAAARDARRQREASLPGCSQCTCCDGSCGCCGRGCCSHHGGTCG